MQRKINKIILDDCRDGFHCVITDVIAGGNHIIECYVGVTSKNDYYSRYSYLELERDERCLVISNEAFSKFGTKKYIDSSADFKKANPIDWAWLTFARAGKGSETTDPSYSFLEKDYFYYGSGFMVRSSYENLSYSKCLDAANTQIERLLTALKTKNKLRNKVFELSQDEVLDVLKDSEYWGKTYYCYYTNTSIIKKTVIDENCKIGLYDFKKDLNQKLYYVIGTPLIIYADKTVVIAGNDNYNYSADNYNDAVIAGLSRDGLHASDVFTVKQKLGDKIFNPYWDLVVSKLGRRLNRHDRNNLLNVLELGENND